MSEDLSINDSPGERLEEYFSVMLEWAKEAYFNDLMFKESVEQAARIGLNAQEMAFHALKCFFVNHNSWKKACMEWAAKLGPITPQPTEEQ